MRIRFALTIAALILGTAPGRAAIRGQLDVQGDGSTSVIDLSHPYLDFNSDALLLAMPRDFNGATGIGVRWDAVKWTLSSNGPTIPSDAHYWVLAFDEGSGFRHVMTVGNSADHVTTLDDPRLNDHPEVLPLVTRELPSGSPAIAFPYGVYYSGGRWKIAFEDTTKDMPVGSSFSVFIPPADAPAFVHVADSGNVSLNYTVVDDPEIADQAAPHRLFVTPVDNVIDNDHWIGVAWLFSHLIGNIDGSAMPEGARFHVFIAPIFANSFEDDGTDLWSARVP